MRFMEIAIALGYRALGNTGANPSVGCVIVNNHQIVGRGFTAPGGRPHAETIALTQAGNAAKGATVYVTLEPCAHHGATPPCAEALIKAGVAKVIFALHDPDPRVNGKGEALLKSAGIATESGLLAEKAAALHSGFLSRIMKGRPEITLKLATSLDGRIALATGESRWITNTYARAMAHRLRATHDAIMIGANTLRHDNPDLTCRLPGLENRSPIRIFMTVSGKIPANAKLFQGNTPTWIFTKIGTQIAQPTENVQIFYTEPAKDGTLPLQDVCQTLGTKGINRLLLEGGGMLAASFLKAQLVDRLIWMQSPRILGKSALPAVGELNVKTLEEAHGFRIRSVTNLEGDCLLTLTRP